MRSFSFVCLLIIKACCGNVCVLLGVVRMGNKACVGLALKVFNTSIGFVSAHFASDSSGKKRLTKRKEVRKGYLSPLSRRRRKGRELQ